MFFAWLRRRRRRRILAQPFPPRWLDYLHDNVGHQAFLSQEERARLRDDLRIFIAEKRWEGCGGLRMSDEIKVTVAAQACLMILGRTLDSFDRVQTILVYPRPYRAPEQKPVGASASLESTTVLLGEAHYRGPVILSWREVLRDGRYPGHGKNLVFHELAHQLDMLNGAADGTPHLDAPEQYRRWQEVMGAEYRLLIKETEQGRKTILDPYGTTNPAEMFAVATECFFDRPLPLLDRHPQLYEVLREYYRQDPAARLGSLHAGG
jgi:Mlc titration factor MtfA (ptsG expression regulator)